MITTSEEYLKHLYRIHDNNLPTVALLLPSTETIYEVDLNTRTISAPEFLSLETDHYAETIFFKVDRYFDNMDLTSTVCLIQYENKNAVKEDGSPAGGYAYLVPFYDVEYLKEENKMLIPWAIGGPATAAAGDVVFAIRFYQLGDNNELIYNLNTIPATSKILHGMNVVTNENENFMIPDSVVAAIYQEIDTIRSKQNLTWIDVF